MYTRPSRRRTSLRLRLVRGQPPGLKVPASAAKEGFAIGSDRETRRAAAALGQALAAAPRRSARGARTGCSVCRPDTDPEEEDRQCVACPRLRRPRPPRRPPARNALNYRLPLLGPAQQLREGLRLTVHATWRPPPPGATRRAAVPRERQAPPFQRPGPAPPRRCEVGREGSPARREAFSPSGPGRRPLRQRSRAGCSRCGRPHPGRSGAPGGA
mmetsp:Transcript_25570/g.79762  ORF Transcript_25570/g.79762 Transcript_25570/m.79762 type:complete len:214 (-) Transcript_25570:342-983(-)